MDQVVGIHIADVGIRSAAEFMRRGAPESGSIPGLLHADLGAGVQLAGSPVRKLVPGRVALITFWSGRDELEAFDREHGLARRFERGWHARLEPLRAYGSWPGLSADIPTSRRTEYDGPAVVLTLGRMRWTESVRFLRTTASAESAAVKAEGFTWGTALARPPFVSTISLWESTRAIAAYAYGGVRPAHRNAIAADARRPFHHAQVFARFRDYHSAGSLGGPNPLSADWRVSPHG